MAQIIPIPDSQQQLLVLSHQEFNDLREAAFNFKRMTANGKVDCTDLCQWAKERFGIEINGDYVIEVR